MNVFVVIPSLPGYDRLNAEASHAWVSTAPHNKVIVYVVNGNRPFAKNVNIGLKECPADKDIIVVANNDASPLIGWYEYLESAIKLKKGLYSFTPKPDCGWMFAMRYDVFQEVGFLDERLINSFEEVDYFIRAALLGYPRFLAPRYYAIHEKGHTINKVWGTLEEKQKVRMDQCEANLEYMKTKWPDLDIGRVLYPYWAVHCLEIMNEWKKKRGISINKTS